MFRTIIVRSELMKSSLRKSVRLNLVRSLTFECTRRKVKTIVPLFLKPTQKIPWRYDFIRFYADYPPHVKVPLPALSPTMETGTIVSWEKKEGDKLNEGDLLCEIETDKATMGFETPEEGYLAKIVIPAGSKGVKIGQIVCIIVENEAGIAAFKDYKDDGSTPSADATVPTAAPPMSLTPTASVAAPSVASPPPAPPSAPAPHSVPAPAATPGARVYASPMAKRLAEQQNIRLQGTGSGLYGSITSKDLAHMGSAAPPPSAPKRASSPTRDVKPASKTPSASAYKDIPLSNMRSVIAKRLLQSKQTIPHYYVSQECCVDKMLAVRQKFNKSLEKKGVKLSVNDFIIKATAMASRKVPAVNSAWMDTFIREFDSVDVSMAVSTDKGLLTPIIFKADTKGLSTISKESKVLALKARDGKLQPAEFQGGTISVSNLGMFGTSHFCAIINPPQSAILAIGTNQKRLVLDENSEKGFRSAEYITVTLSCDHRVIDGALAANWLKAFRGYIEEPETMLL